MIVSGLLSSQAVTLRQTVTPIILVWSIGLLCFLSLYSIGKVRNIGLAVLIRVNPCLIFEGECFGSDWYQFAMPCREVEVKM